MKTLQVTATYRTPLAEDKKIETFTAPTMQEATHLMCLRLESLAERGYIQAHLRAYDPEHPVHGLAYAHAIHYKGRAIPKPTGSQEVRL
jgi:hypothetical protein